MICTYVCNRNQIFISFFKCHTNVQNVPSAKKSEPRGATVVCFRFCSDRAGELSLERVTDQAPSQTSRNIREEAIPKSVARVLNASQIRSEWKQSLGKRKHWDKERGLEPDFQNRSRKKSRTKGSDAGAVPEDTKLPPMRIQPGESLAHFNKLSRRSPSSLLPNSDTDASRTPSVHWLNPPLSPLRPICGSWRRRCPNRSTESLRNLSIPRVRFHLRR